MKSIYLCMERGKEWANIADDGRQYIGESAARELEYARRMGKRIRFYSQEQG